MPTAGLLQRTGNVVWVDAVNGNDASGTSGDPLHPFLTVGAALAVAVSGDEILVYPGTYAESGLTVPAGTTLKSSGGYQVTRIGDVSAVADIVTLSADSQIEGFAVDCPDTLGLSGVLFDGGVSSASSIYNCQFHGDGAVGQGNGLRKIGGGKIIGAEIRFDTGGLRSCMVNESGVIAVESIHVPPGPGTIDAVVRGESAGRFQIADFNVGSPNVTDGVYCDGTSTTLIFGINTLDLSNSIHIVSDGINLSVLGGKMDQSAFAVLADPALLGTGTVVRITANHETAYNFPPAMLNSDFGLSFFREQNDTSFSQQRTFGVDSVFGFPEKGSSVYAGSGSPYADGIKVVTSNATGTGGLVDVTADASSISGSTITFQGTAAGHRIYFGSLRQDTASVIKHWGLQIAQSAAGVGGSYEFKIWNGAAWENVGVEAVSEEESYRYANDVFLRASSEEELHYGIDDDSTWATTSVDAVTAYWSCVEIISAPSVLPTFERTWLTPSTSQINRRGRKTASGLAKWRGTLSASGNVFGESGGVVLANVDVGSGGTPTGWTHPMPNSRLNQTGDAIYFQFAIPEGICTAHPLDMSVVYKVDGSTPITVAPELTMSVYTAEVAGNLVADPAGGIDPTPRILANTDVLTTGIAEFDAQNLVPAGAVLPATYDDYAIDQEFAAFDASSYYEGDVLFVRVELTDDGTPNQDVIIIALVVNGIKFSLGGAL
ncbi:MAG: hypothetical protein HN738_02415 [Gammaproteobacteria bacterium]|mgnify:CR=1 FL=1|nr:hypothetical protein [Gammaproteobacteria bacterium]